MRNLPEPSSERRAFDGLEGAEGPSGVVLLSSNAEAWATRWQMIADADRRIDTATFILERDIVGLAFLGHLYERAREGVEVHLRIDARGSASFAPPLAVAASLQDLADAGADVRIYNPPLNQLARTLVEANAAPVSACAHEKILAVDGRRAVTGGRNIASVYYTLPSENRGAVVDDDVLLEGRAVTAQLARIVDRADNEVSVPPTLPPDAVPRADLLMMAYGAMDAWLHGDVVFEPSDAAVLALEAAGLARLPGLPPRAVRDDLRPYLRELASYHSLYGTLPLDDVERDYADVRVVYGGGGADGQEHHNSATDALLRCIAGAHNRILIQSPYVMLTRGVLVALARASRRGVNIDIVTNSPSSSDNDASQALFIDSWPELEARLPTLRVFVAADGQMQHVKRVVCDEDLTLLGSYNLDPLSAHLNSEVVVGIWSPDVTEQNRKIVDDRINGGEVLEYRIARDTHGRAMRDGNGNVVVAFGPRNHVPARRLAELESLKRFLFSVRGIWDFEFVVW